VGRGGGRVVRAISSSCWTEEKEREEEEEEEEEEGLFKANARSDK